MTTSEPVTEPDLTPIQKFGEVIADRVERWMPSPFLFAILLTYVAAGAAFISEGSAVSEIALSWYGGFWDLLQFAMQMVIILVTANVVAYHPRVRGVILSLVAASKERRAGRCSGGCRIDADRMDLLGPRPHLRSDSRP